MLRELDRIEIESVSGGEGNLIVVTGERYRDEFLEDYLARSRFESIDLGPMAQPQLEEAPSDSNLQHECPFENETAEDSEHPEGFDSELDKKIDEAAAAVGEEIASKSDSLTREYSAVIWVDANGNVHTTSVQPGTSSTATGIGQNYSEVDFANGGKIVAIMHSHPDYTSGTVQGQAFTFNSGGSTLSSIDFDTLMNISNGSIDGADGYDSTNYRSYLAFGSQVSEFYASDQDPSFTGAGGQATWAVKSSDYNENTGQEDQAHVCPAN